MAKPIYFSTHAREQMLLRGAEEDEVIAAIRSSEWQEAKQGKFHARAQFEFNQVSPMNEQFYNYKIVDTVFADKPGRIVVVTVKVYYFN